MQIDKMATKNLTNQNLPWSSKKPFGNFLSTEATRFFLCSLNLRDFEVRHLQRYKTESNNDKVFNTHQNLKFFLMGDCLVVWFLRAAEREWLADTTLQLLLHFTTHAAAAGAARQGHTHTHTHTHILLKLKCAILLCKNDWFSLSRKGNNNYN